jgi:hypothetical protein
MTLNIVRYVPKAEVGAIGEQLRKEPSLPDTCSAALLDHSVGTGEAAIVGW